MLVNLDYLICGFSLHQKKKKQKKKKNKKKRFKKLKEQKEKKKGKKMSEKNSASSGAKFVLVVVQSESVFNAGIILTESNCDVWS